MKQPVTATEVKINNSSQGATEPKYRIFYGEIAQDDDKLHLSLTEKSNRRHSSDSSNNPKCTLSWPSRQALDACVQLKTSSHHQNTAGTHSAWLDRLKYGATNDINIIVINAIRSTKGRRNLSIKPRLREKYLSIFLQFFFACILK